ncbi:cation:proton antiporter [Neisseria zalophi]|uniref:Sodium:proton antiporter n=1 Tax=Neisseria zalophi TaxID=640030 RepID=A0A5J6PT94_9NEIS|nr:sodium:proton antiporter [Neisseria zalophi]QEY25941.1 sodium:proton antiporter [Neisseria zalophi]
MDTALLLSGVLALGIGAQWLAWYLKQPSILFLLLIGIIIGPVLGYFQPDAVLGELLFPFISLGVAVILFEGSLTLEFHEVKQHGRMVQNLVTIGAFITIIVISLTAYLLFDIDPQVALLFGSLVCVTGPTVITPLLRSVRPKKNISNILKWEGIIIDPIGAIAVVLVYEYIISGGHNSSLLLFGEIVLLAFVIGMVGAAVLAFLIKRYWIPEYLRNVFTLAYVLFLFSFSNHLEHESGLLTVTVLGVALANWKGFPRDHILEFNESLTVLLISMLFIILAARMDLAALATVGFSGIVLLLIVMFVARPLAVWVSAKGTSLTTNEKLMISWIGPRGIVAAAISSLFAIRLEDQNLQGVELLVPLVFLIIIGTVLIQGLGAKLVGTILQVREPGNNGVLIVGANQAALTVAKAIKEQGFEVLVADASYTNISKARMIGLRTYYGNPVSEHAELHMDLIGIGHMFAMSTDRELNTLCEMHYRHEFGERNVYRLQLPDEKSRPERHRSQQSFSSNYLFGKDMTYSKLASMVSKNARTKTTNITATYNYTQYQQDNKNAIPLLVIDKNGVMRVITTDFNSKSQTGYKLVALVTDNEETEMAKA